MQQKSHFLAALILASAAIYSDAGTIFYQAVPAAESDANCGISSDNQYTSAVDGGNTRGTDRVINGITLYAMPASGQSSSADNCTLNALSGSLSNAGGFSGSIKADGVNKEALSDMTFNAGAGDNSQQEIVLDPESLESGTTYDLRVYICNSAGQNRQVSLSFVGDGQAAVETGFFNEDDARTSAGGFSDANQVYYINYRFTWDGDSTPGITITQKSGSAPFCLYALTNQVVSAGGAAAGAAGREGGEDLTSGLVNEESDEVGVASDDFYNSESLNSNGRWVKLDRWGTCWQPTDVPSGWCPYTNGSWKECDDCGWTFVSDEPWAWACYHYGRWCKVRTGCGWAWVPGKVWGASWVSWRRGRGASSSSIGWAPLPPEASCELNVGISTWVDRTCDIGPDYYTFVNIRDFGSDSYWGCGCIYERSRNVTVIIDTFNCTNIYYNRNVIYSGGPDFNWCNTEIRRLGGREVGKIYVNRYTDPGKFKGGKFARQEGNQLALLSPHIRGDRNPKHTPRVAESLGSDKIDKGWGNVKDKKLERNLRNHIAEESKGKDPKTAKATLPPDVAQKLGRHHGAQAGGLAGGGGGGGQHPGKGKLQGQGAAGAGAGAGGTAAAGGTSGFNQHPGGKGKGKGQRAAGAGAGAAGTETAGAGGGAKGRHPGQSLKGQRAGGAGAATAGAGAAGVGASGAGGGRHPGKHKGKGAQGAQTGASGGQAGANIQGGGTQGGQAGGQSAGGGKGRHKGKQTQGQVQGGTQGGQGGMNQGAAGQAGQGGQGAGGGRGGKGRHRQQQTQGLQGGQGTQAGGTGGIGGQGQGGKGRRKQQQTLQGARGTQGGGTGGAGGQGQGGKDRRKQQQPTQQLQQTQGQGSGGGGGRQQHKQRQLQSNQQQQYQQQQYQQQQQQQQQPQQQKRGGRKGKKPPPTATPYP